MRYTEPITAYRDIKEFNVGDVIISNGGFEYTVIKKSSDYTLIRDNENGSEHKATWKHNKFMLKNGKK